MTAFIYRVHFIQSGEEVRRIGRADFLRVPVVPSPMRLINSGAAAPRWTIEEKSGHALARAKAQAGVL